MMGERRGISFLEGIVFLGGTVLMIRRTNLGFRERLCQREGFHSALPVCALCNMPRGLCTMVFHPLIAPLLLELQVLSSGKVKTSERAQRGFNPCLQ